MEQINYLIVIPFAVIVVVLIAYLIHRDRKDQKKVEKELIDTDVKPWKH